MKQARILFICLMLIPAVMKAQKDSSGWLRAFPITDYMVNLNDSTKVLQVELPDGLQIPDRQLGILYGTYRQSAADAVQKGYGRCYLIKGNYFYFAIGHNKSGIAAAAGDIIYVNLPPGAIYYGRYPQLAGHFIRLNNVTDSSLYDRYLIFSKWTQADEAALTAALVKDVQYTGDYFLQNAPEMNVTIAKGPYAGKKLLELMGRCTEKQVEDFADYMLARPRNYAGREWKFAEIFATWLNEGAPTVVK